MKFGYQTIIFGRRVRDWDRVFDYIADAGFHGVELFQTPTEVAPNIDILFNTLRKFRLDLVGLAGGSILDRMTFLGDFKEPYLYADRFEHDERVALEQGYTIAVHPHAFKPIRCLSDATKILNAPENNAHRSRLLLLPDTAHLWIVGDDPMTGIRAFRDRLAAIHLKDWDSCYGRGSHRLSHGFTNLGKGVARIRQTLEGLSELHSSQNLWVIVEKDYSEESPALDVYQAARQLMEWGHLTPRGFAKFQTAQKVEELVVIEPNPEIELAYRRSLDTMLSRTEMDVRYLIGPLKTLLPDLRAVALYSYREDASYLVLLATSPDTTDPNNVSLSPPASPSSADLLNTNGPLVSALGHARQPWEKTIPSSFRRYRYPILDIYNPHQVQYVIDYYAPAKWHYTELAGRLSAILGAHLEYCLDQRCQQFAGSVSRIAASHRTFADFARGLRELIGDAIGCEAVAVLLADASLTILRAAGSDEALEWNPILRRSQQVYLRGDGTDTSEAWERGIPSFCDLTTDRESKEPWKSRLKVTHQGTGSKQFLHFPVLDITGGCIGIIRCGGKLPPIFYFHHDDLAVLDSILHVSVPRLLSLKAENERREKLGSVTHELKRPTLAIRTAVELIDREFNERAKRYGIPMLEYPWIKDVMSWCDLMSNIIMNPDYLRSDVSLRLDPVRVLPSVVAPIVRMLSLTLRTHRYLRPLRPDGGRSIEYDSFEQFDRRLYIDDHKFQQVLFNLLDNAIKYAKPARPDEFRVDLISEYHHDAYWIKVQDWGIGIDPKIDDPDILFEEGVRGPRAHIYEMAGTGYGLWVVRRLLELHHCSISITQRLDPTEFTIRIPAVLSRANWQQILGGPDTHGHPLS